MIILLFTKNGHLGQLPDFQKFCFSFVITARHCVSWDGSGEVFTWRWMCALCSITISVLATIGVLTEFCRWWRAEELCYGWEAILDRWACWEWSIEGLRWLRCFIVVVVVMAHSSKDPCFKFYILLQGLDGVQVPVRRVLARTDYQAPTCAEWVPISLLSNSRLQMTHHQRLEG